MPSVSAKQHRLMEAVAHDPAIAKKTGIPQSVGKEFVAKDSTDTHPCSRYMDAIRSGDPEMIRRASQLLGAK